MNALSDKYPNHSLGELITCITSNELVISLLPFFVLGSWLWMMEKRDKGRPILWALSGLILQYWALLLFIGWRVYEKDKGSRNQTT